MAMGKSDMGLNLFWRVYLQFYAKIFFMEANLNRNSLENKVGDIPFSVILFYLLLYGLGRDKTCLWVLQQSEIQTCLFSYRD